ncbi:MAG: hypothetical protein A2057_06195 [Ignavibacteria bacterium GWA2_35_9]|nr:MAG: hypothetical protein A2057_06195 [Ignavibacteria bacterium GWA2_35_9]
MLIENAALTINFGYIINQKSKSKIRLYDCSSNCFRRKKSIIINDIGIGKENSEFSLLKIK